jgi:hypothetical protein
VVSYFEGVDGIFRIGPATFHNVVGRCKVRLDPINRKSRISVIPCNVISDRILVAKNISSFPVFALESNVLLVKLSQDAHYRTAP